MVLVRYWCGTGALGVVSRAIFCVRTLGARARKRGCGKNTYVWCNRFLAPECWTNQIADKVIGHQRSCEYHAVCVIFTKTKRRCIHKFVKC